MGRNRCVICGKLHGIIPSSALGRWHECTNCGSIYCDDCGSNLPRDGFLSRTRSCPRCGQSTRLID